MQFSASKLKETGDVISGLSSDTTTERIHWCHKSSSFKIQIPQVRIGITEGQEEVP